MLNKDMCLTSVGTLSCRENHMISPSIPGQGTYQPPTRCRSGINSPSVPLLWSPASVIIAPKAGLATLPRIPDSSFTPDSTRLPVLLSINFSGNVTL